MRKCITARQSGACALQGAVYVTDNGAYTWQAAVQETVDATLNRTVSSGALCTLVIRIP